MTHEGNVKALEISTENYVEDADLDMIAGGGFEGDSFVGGGGTVITGEAG